MQTGQARLADALERGAFARPRILAQALERAWGFATRGSIVRELRFVGATRVVAIGGAVLGGSGKTPLALACALELAAHGGVALVGHAYGASPCRARIVLPDDDVAEVGDEALACARALERAGAARARVVVAPRRQEAVTFAETFAATLVLDSIAQSSPRPADLALLALDAESPWGTGQVPPSGDLRAPRDALLEACDRVVVVGDAPDADARVLSRGVDHGGRLVPWEELAGVRVGLFTALARPWRVLRFLARRHVTPVAVLHSLDHRASARAAAALRRLTREHAVDLWLATPKCGTHVAEEGARGIPIGVLDHTLELSRDVRHSLLLSDVSGARTCPGP